MREFKGAITGSEEQGSEPEALPRARPPRYETLVSDAVGGKPATKRIIEVVGTPRSHRLAYQMTARQRCDGATPEGIRVIGVVRNHW